MEVINRSRRDLLKLAGAGAAAAGIAVLAAPMTALADPDPGDVGLDFENVGTGTTSVASPTIVSPNAALLGQSTANQVGVYGHSSASDDTPDLPFTLNSDSPVGAGVYGESTQDNGSGVVGAASGGAGGENGALGLGTTGVFGIGFWGTYGLTLGTLGVGAFGDASESAIGVYGWTGTTAPVEPANGGVAVYARAANQTSLTALQVIGKAKFSRSGTATVPKNKKSVKVNLAGTTTTSLVFAVLGKLVTGRYVAAAVAATGSFTIYLNGNVSAATKVNYVVFDK